MIQIFFHLQSNINPLRTLRSVIASLRVCLKNCDSVGKHFKMLKIQFVNTVHNILNLL